MCGKKSKVAGCWEGSVEHGFDLWPFKVLSLMLVPFQGEGEGLVPQNMGGGEGGGPLHHSSLGTACLFCYLF